MKFRAFWICIIVIISAMVIVIDSAPLGEAATLYVGGTGGGNYTLIQDAITAAFPGDEIFVYNGVYNEIVTVDKTLTLTGENRDLTIIDGGGLDNVVTITANWVNMTGFTVTGGDNGWSDGGLILSNVQNCHVADNNVSDNGRDGIRVINTQNSTVENNYISGNVDEGIHIQNSFENNIINNTIMNHHGSGFGGTADGILVYLSSNNIVASNYLFDNDIGINVIDGSNTNIITDNIVTQNTQYGIAIDSSIGNNLTSNSLTNNGIFISGNLIEHWNTHSIDISNSVNGKTAYYWKNQTGGVIPAGAGEVILANCTNVDVNGQFITNSSVGIEMGFSSDNNILNNDVWNQSRGIYLYSSDDNIINDNTAYMNGIGINNELSNNNSIINNNLMNNINHGTYLWSVTNHTLTNNNITGNDVGIYYRDSSIGDIMNNNISDNNWGMWIRESTSSNFTSNNVSMNIIGIRVRASESNNISFNDLYSNTDYGIYITSASYQNWVGNNTITDTVIGIIIAPWGNWRPSDNYLMGNIISDCEAGIYLNAILSNTLSENTMSQCGIFIDGNQLEHWNEHFIDTSNTVNGKPVYYWTNQTSGSVPADAGEVILANCSGVDVTSAVTTFGTVGIEMGFSNSVQITFNNASSNNWYGIYLYSSNVNTLWGNTASFNDRSGIHIGYSTGNNLIFNMMELDGIWIEGFQMNFWNTHSIDTTNEVNGNPVYYWSNQTSGTVPTDAGEVILANCSNVLVENTNPDWGTVGIQMGFSNDNTIDNNNLSNSRYGLYLTNSDGNTILNNTVSYNTEYGIQLQVCDNNLIYHNNLIGNTDQADDDQPGNSWNEVYSISGNYWSDYNGNDIFNGPLQDILGSDGVGDTPHALDSNTFDFYPLIDPWNPLRTPPTEPLTLVALAGNIFVNLTWSPPSSDGGYPVYKYMVYRGLFSGGETFYMDVGNTLTFNDTAVTPGELYFYKITAVNILGEGPFSNEVSGMPVAEPSEPTGLGIIGGDSFVNLTWSPPSDDGGSAITGYNIYRDDMPGVYQFVPAGQLWFEDLGLTNGVTYTYNVTAINGEGEGPNSGDISATPLTVPDSPTGLTAQEGNSYINLTWNPPASDGGSPITNYVIYRGTVSGGEIWLTEIGNITYFNDTGLTNGQEYFYFIRAKNSEGEGPDSSEISEIPKRPPFGPSNLQVNVGDTMVNLSWLAPANDGGSNVTGYRIYKGNESGNLTFLIEIGNILYYEETDVTNGDTYYYQISAINIMGEGSKSNEISATPGTTPGIPGGVSAEAGDSFIEISWNAPTSDGGSPITDYVIYRGTSSGGEIWLADIGSVLEFNDTSVSNGMTYYYKVAAKNAAGEGQPSSEVSDTPMGLPSEPNNVAIVAGESYLLVTWEAPITDGGSSITNYYIYRGTTSGGEAYWDEVSGVLFYNDSTVTPGMEYFYTVSAVTTIGEGPQSNEVSETLYEYPGAPKNLTATAGDSYIYLAWAAPDSEGSSSITTYLIFRGTASGVLSRLDDTENVLFYNDTAVTNGNKYFYVVIAENSEGEGLGSSEVNATPSGVPRASTNLAAQVGDGYVQLTWNAPASDGGSAITNYRVYRGTTSGNLTLLEEIGNILSYNDTSVTNGVMYHYYITSVNIIGEGAHSTEILAIPFVDTDGDNQPDHEDNDDDNDGILDTEEDKNGNGVVDTGETDPLDADSDDDGHNDKVDVFPLDSSKWEEEEPESSFLIWIILLIIIIVVVLVLFLATRKKGEPKDEVPPAKEEKELPPPPGAKLEMEEGPEAEAEEPEGEIGEPEEPKEEESPAVEEPTEEDEEPPPPDDEELEEPEKPMDEEPPAPTDEDISPQEEPEKEIQEPGMEDEQPQTEPDTQNEVDKILDDLTDDKSS
jgi:parallel beta-helix repeat protein